LTRHVTAALSVVCAAVLLASSAFAYAAPLTPSFRRTLDDTLTIGHLFRIDSLNPFAGLSNEAYIFYSLVYDYLFSVDEDQDYVFNIATSAMTPDGGRTWVYEIRPDVLWHDGTPMTAQDVAFTINYNIQSFWSLWAYEPYVEDIIQCPLGQTTGCGAQVTAPGQVTVYFQNPFAPGGSSMLVPIIQQRQWQNISATKAQYGFDNRNPIGTGPYMADEHIFEAWLANEPLVLHANPNYHFGEPKVKHIAFQLFDSEPSMVAALLAGEIDVAMLGANGYGGVSAAARPEIELQEGLTVIQYWIDIGFVLLNNGTVNSRLNPARFDLRVREALAHATNRSFILQQFYLNKGQVGSTLVSPVQPFWHYEPTAGEIFEYDLDRANAILDAAGYDARNPQGVRVASRDLVAVDVCDPAHSDTCASSDVTIPAGTPLQFDMVVRQEASEERQIAQYLKDNWAQLGVQVDYRVVLESAMTNIVYGGEVESYIWWWSADVDPNYILSIQSDFALNGWSDNYFDNRTYNLLYRQHLAAMNRTDRQGYVHEAQRVHYAALPFIILVYPFFHYAWWTDEFTGWGDMNAHPGRQVGAFFGKHPLFLSLEPTGQGNVFAQSLPVLIGLAVGAAIAAGVGVALYISRGRRRKEEDLPPPLPPPNG
jgi:ABC-type transport system substrate-binding protein